MTGNRNQSGHSANTGISTRAQVMLVLQREIVERSRQRVFLVSTLVTIGLIIAAVVLPKLLDSPTQWTIGVTDQKSTRLAESAKQLLLTAEPDAKVTINKVESETGRPQITDGSLDMLLSAPDAKAPTATVDRSLSDAKRAVLSSAIQQQRIIDEAQRLGISSDDAFALLAPGELNVDVLDPPDPAKDSDRALAFAAAILMFFQVMQFGMAIATGVVEEKSSRVLELLLGRMSSRTLLTGKLLGIGLVGLVQTLIFVIVGLVTVKVTGMAKLSGASWKLGALTVAWFVVGYLLFSGLFLIAGALAGRQEDLQSTTGLALIISMASYFASIFISGSPDSGWARIASVIPFCAPMSQPLRFADGSSSWPEMLFAFGLCAVTIWLLIRFAARIYNRTVLMKTQTSLIKTIRQRA
jgi:ABC-2 type transport system permease protein